MIKHQHIQKQDTFTRMDVRRCKLHSRCPLITQASYWCALLLDVFFGAYRQRNVAKYLLEQNNPSLVCSEAWQMKAGLFAQYVWTHRQRFAVWCLLSPSTLHVTTWHQTYTQKVYFLWYSLTMPQRWGWMSEFLTISARGREAILPWPVGHVTDYKYSELNRETLSREGIT